MTPAELAALIVPIFIFIAIGALLIGLKVLPATTGDTLGDVVFTLAVPALIFRSVGTLELPDIAPWPFWGTYFAAVAVGIVVAIAVAERGFGRDPVSGIVAAIAATFSNLIMVGIPLISRAFGEAGLVTLFLLIAVHVPVMMTIAAVLSEVAAFRSGDRPRIGEALLRVVMSLLTNPIVIGIIAGFALRLSGLPLTGIVRDVVDRIADTAVPLALVALGMNLPVYGVRGTVGPSAALAAVKLVMMPGLVYLLATEVAGLEPLPTAVLVLAAACPTGVNAYLVAGRYRAGLALAGSAITLSTALSLATLTLWLALLAG